MDTWHDNPFPGLRPFQTDEAHLFFGRDGQAVELLRLLRQHRFVAVVGPSGSGKSSLVRAGLLPCLHGGVMRSAGSSWRMAVLRPGANPIGNLARALADPEVLGDGELDERDRREFMEITLRRGSLGLAEAVSEARLPAGENLLVVVDQFEEIFRFQRASAGTGTRDDAAAFVKLLLEAGRAEGVPAFVLLTMRSDYLGDCAQFRDLPEAINRGQYLIPRMTRDERRLAITGPVAVGRGEIAPRLVSRILNDVGDEPDQLPILQHALMRAWDCWHGDGAEGGPLDLEHYEAVGGAQDALSRHAEEAYADLDARGQDVAEKIFRRLTERGPDNRDIRRPTRFGDLYAVVGAEAGEVAAVVEVFRRPGRSFLMPPAEVPLEDGTLVDISHESLIRGWKRLRDWVEEEAEAAKRYRRLADTAALWKAGRAGLLVDPIELDDTLEWWDRDQPVAAWGHAYHSEFEAAEEYLRQSREQRDRERQRERARAAAKRRLRAITFAALVVGLVFTTSLSLWAWEQRRSALDQKRQADEAEYRAIVARDSVSTLHDFAESRRKEAERTRDSLGDAVSSLHAAVRAKDVEARRADAETERAQAMAAIAQRTTRAERRAMNEQLEGMTTLREFLGRAQVDASIRNEYSLASQEAWAFSNLGLHRAAERSYSNALRFNPQDPFALVNRSDTYINLGRPDSARADLEVLLGMAPNDFLARLNMAVAELMSGNYTAAARSFRRAIQGTQYGVVEAQQSMVSPDIQRVTGQRTLTIARHEIPASLRFALASTQAFDPQGSRTFMDSLRSVDQQEDWSMNAVLNALNWLWLTRQQISWYQTADYGEFAAEGALWERAGWSKAMRGRGEFAEEAARSYCRFRKLHEERGNAHYAELARWVNSRLVSLRPAGCTALNLDPVPLATNVGEVEDLLLSARRLQAQDSLRPVESLYTLALRKATPAERPFLLVDRGWTRSSLGDGSGDAAVRKRYYRAAIADADSALALRPTLADAYFLRGRTRYDEATWDDLQDERKVASIAADLDAALRYQPTLVNALFTRAWTYVRVDAGKAAESLRAALRLSPEEPGNWAELALLEMRNGEYGQALKAAEQAVRLAPDSVQYYEVTEAARLRFPATSLESFQLSNRASLSPEISVPLGQKFLQIGEAAQVLGEPLRAEHFYLAALREYTEAMVVGTPGLQRQVLEAGRRYRCSYLQGARHDPRRTLFGRNPGQEPGEEIEWPSPEALRRARKVLAEVDRKFDPQTSCAAPPSSAGR